MFEFFKKKKSIDNKDQIATLSAEDETVKSYMERAQEELPYLIDFMSNNPYEKDLFRYSVKANFIEDDKSEHMWVQVTEFKNDYFVGKLVNYPSTIKLIKYGDPVKVLRENVEDWILEDFLTLTKVGQFSSEYLRRKAQERNKDVS